MVRAPGTIRAPSGATLLSFHVNHAPILRLFASSPDLQHSAPGADPGPRASASALSHLDQVKAYLAGQAEHHRTVTFQEEFRAFLKRHTIAYDERYLGIEPRPAGDTVALPGLGYSFRCWTDRQSRG